MLSLEAYKDPVLTPVLESLLKDTDPLIRSRAACQLAKTTGKLYEYDGDYRPWPGTECEALQKQLRAALPAERIRSDELKMQAAVQAAYEATLSTGPEQAVVPLTKAQIDSDLFPSYGLSKYRQTEWLRIVSDLPEPRRSQDSEMILKRVHVWPVVMDNIWSSGNYLPQEVRNIQDYLKVLGESKSNVALKVINQQGEGLENAIHQERYTVPQDIAVGNDTRAAKSKAAIERDTSLLRDIKRALLPLARSNGVGAFVWTTSEWVGSMGEPKNHHYVLRFRVMSLTNNITMTVLDRKTMQPFRDDSGILWDNLRLDIPKGEVFPYEGPFSIPAHSWLHLKLVFHSPNAPDHIIDEANTTKDEPKFAE
jgi:hypothetical protein